MEKNIFEIASRERLRFPFKGLVSTEDLWALPVKDLDLVFKTLNSQLKQSSEESLLDTKTQQDEELETKIEIIKHIVGVKILEEAAKFRAKKNKEQKQKILEVIASKQDSALEGLSIEELQKMVEELGK